MNHRGELLAEHRPDPLVDRSVRVPGRLLRGDARERRDPTPRRDHPHSRRFAGTSGELGSWRDRRLWYFGDHHRQPAWLLGWSSGGRPFVLQWGHYVGVTHERLLQVEGFFVRHGGKAV